MWRDINMLNFHRDYRVDNKPREMNRTIFTRLSFDVENLIFIRCLPDQKDSRIIRVGWNHITTKLFTLENN